MDSNERPKGFNDHHLMKSGHNQGQSRGLILSYLLKGEPPDVQPIPEPIRYQGKVLDSQRRMKPNLLSLGAEYTVLRSKLIQVGGYDEDIKSSSTMEQRNLWLGVESMKLKRAKEAGQDICSFKMPYLINQEDICHETNFRGFYTHQCSNTKWNHHKIFPDQKDTDFTNWRFSSPSISESRPLKDESSPILILSATEILTGFKVGLLAFHKDQNQKKWTQKSQDMNHFLEPVLHLAYLEAHWFKHLQTKLWRPGEKSMHSEDTSKGPEESDTFFPCTINHRIRRILHLRHFPFIDASCILNLQQLFPFDLCELMTFQDTKRLSLHGIMKKISRYKGQRRLTIPGAFTLAQRCSNSSFPFQPKPHLIFVIIFELFSFP